MTTTVDIHAHMLPEETIRLLGKESPRVAPKLITQPGDLHVDGAVGAPRRVGVRHVRSRLRSDQVRARWVGIVSRNSL